MTAYIIRRLFYTVPIVFGVLLLTFVLFTVVGGDISLQIAGKGATPETIEEIREERGFNKPLFFTTKEPVEDANGFKIVLAQDGRRVFEENGNPLETPDPNKGEVFKTHISFDSQFLEHIKNALTFNFGRALDRELVMEKIKRGVRPSLSLMIPMFFGIVFISISLSLIIAFVRGTKWDVFAVVICVVGMSMPYLSFILFGQYFFAYKWGFFPVFFSPELATYEYTMLPVLIGIATGLGGNVRFYRTVMLDEMRNDYVRTAFAKGLSIRRVLFKHVLKNAMIPIITRVVLAIPFLFLGSLLLERFFGIPGLGYLMIEAIGARDRSVIFAMTYISAILFVIFNLLTDVCYAMADPRVSFD